MVATRRRTELADVRSQGTARRKRRPHPPWGDILGGKPIERHYWHLNERLERRGDLVQQEQFLRMLRLKEHYQIPGGNYEYPIKGLASADWVPWYELALAIASEFDDSLKIVDAGPRGRTAPRWRGLEGRVLLLQVEATRRAFPHRSVRWCLRQIQKVNPAYGGPDRFDQLVVRYQEAKKYFGTTKRARNREDTS